MFSSLPAVVDQALQRSAAGLARAGVPTAAAQQLLQVMRNRVQHHGDVPRWCAALAALPELPISEPAITDRIALGDPAVLCNDTEAALKNALQALTPWRKGPWSFYGLDIDTEWRSDWKWQRLAPHLGSLQGHRVLDVGSGNGYYGWRMLAAGADQVIAVDPTLVFLMQHLAVCRYLPDHWHHRLDYLPLRLEDLPPANGQFDTVFSMGVLYHRRDPAKHLRELWHWLRPGGQLVLETLTVPGATPLILDGKQRYARMRNVWTLATAELLTSWLHDCGFDQVRVVDQNATTVAEQHSTDWMPFESLPEALDPADATRTVEGHPAPCRTLILANRPPACSGNGAPVQGEA
jgi:tRNA (mo5U34)-methyltransferase